MTIRWTHKYALAAGILLILLTNAVALLGVAYNRSGPPQSRLVLSERELDADRGWSYREENSNLALQLAWRVLPEQGKGRDDPWTAYLSYSSGSPEWLDAKKLAELGFDLPADMPADSRRRVAFQREVLLVLEMNGPAYQHALERARARLAET